MRQIVLALVLLSVPAPAPLQEVVTLQAPVFTSAGAVNFRVWQLVLKRSDADQQPTNDAEVRATFREVTGSTFVANGRTLTCSYSGATADALIVALNSMNFATTSLEKRIITRCQADGLLGAGTVTGSAGH